MDKLDINLHVKDTDVFNTDVSKKEMNLLKMRKSALAIPSYMTLEEMPWGFMEPSKNKDNFVNSLNIFPLILLLVKERKQDAYVTVYDTDHNKFLNQINKTKMKNISLKIKRYCVVVLQINY